MVFNIYIYISYLAYHLPLALFALSPKNKSGPIFSWIQGPQQAFTTLCSFHLHTILFPFSKLYEYVILSP
jgi:hypothetical protein